MEYSIEVCNLTKKYPLVKRYRDILLHPFKQEKMTALQDISFSVNKGELFGLLGPNGAGKTTLLKILATLILPDKGIVKVNGLDVEKQPSQVRRSIGFVVTEERSFYWRLTGWQNLEFFAVLNNVRRKDIKERLEKILTLVGLYNDAHRMFKDYSAGMKQRLSIARSLLSEPDILIMDEPTRSLDPTAAKNLREFIRDDLVLSQGKTVCLSTHNLYEAENLCSRILILHKGRLIACDTPNNIKSLLPVASVIEVHLLQGVRDTRSIINGLCAKKGYQQSKFKEDGQNIVVQLTTEENSTDISSIVEEFSRAGFQVTACFPKEPTLEEVFDQIIGN
jgi:ABC-2 type transport system ATP-binding protein